jgi:hypothetical protein
MAIQELNTIEINAVTGAGLFDNLGNGGLNPVNGLVNLLTNLDLGQLVGGLLTGVFGLLANPGALLQAIDLGGILAVVFQTVGDLLGNSLGL